MIYFDNAATTRPDGRAVRRAMRWIEERWFNPSALYREGLGVHGDLKEAREFLVSRVASPAEVSLVFTACGSEADNQALFSFAKRGNLVITGGEHAAVFAAANELKCRGVELRVAPLNGDGGVNEEALLSLVDEKTSLVSVIHVNNETGAVNDVNALAAAVKKKNPRVIFHSDGVQAFGKIPYKMGASVDLYSVSAHKIGGLKGVGGLFVRKKIYAALRPYIYGGGQEDGKRSGTENTFGIMQFRFAAENKFSALTEDLSRVLGYRETLWSGLDKAVFTRISPADGSPYILTVSAAGLRGETLLHLLDDRGLVVGTGSACSSNAKKRYSRVILACGRSETEADGVLRLSFSPETTQEEITAATDILNGCAAELKKRMNI